MRITKNRFQHHDNPLNQFFIVRDYQKLELHENYVKLFEMKKVYTVGVTKRKELFAGFTSHNYLLHITLLM